jgi:hypothetical protein
MKHLVQFAALLIVGLTVTYATATLLGQSSSGEKSATTGSWN